MTERDKPATSDWRSVWYNLGRVYWPLSRFMSIRLVKMCMGPVHDCPCVQSPLHAGILVKSPCDNSYGYDRVALVLNLNNYILGVPNSR